jgi:hypothetical protein
LGGGWSGGEGPELGGEPLRAWEARVAGASGPAGSGGRPDSPEEGARVRDQVPWSGPRPAAASSWREPPGKARSEGPPLLTELASL